MLFKYAVSYKKFCVNKVSEHNIKRKFKPKTLCFTLIFNKNVNSRINKIFQKVYELYVQLNYITISNIRDFQPIFEFK